MRFIFSSAHGAFIQRTCYSVTIALCAASVQLACSSDPSAPKYLAGAGSVGSNAGAAGAPIGAGGSPVAGSTGSVVSGGAESGGASGASLAGGTFTGGAGADTMSAGGSGTAGSAGTAAGGAAGSGMGGAGIEACGVSTGSDKNIDDFEDGDTVVKLADGRSGYWQTYNDGSVGGVFSSHSPTALVGHNGSTGFCTDVSGFKAWGANLVANMGAPACGYDATPYSGVCFWAKGKAMGGSSVILAVGTKDTVPTGSGGACLVACNAHYEHKIALTDAYQQFCYKWSEFAAPTIAANATPKPPLDKSHIVQLEWKFPAKNKTSTDGSLCIDDVVFE